MTKTRKLINKFLKTCLCHFFFVPLQAELNRRTCIRMNNIADPNSQPQIPQEMPPQQSMPQGGAFVPPMMGRGRDRQMAELVLFPKWLSRNALITYLLSLAVVTFMYSAYSIPWYYMLSGVVSMMVFFLYGAKVVQDTAVEKIRKEKNFEKRIFLIAFIPRVLWMVLIYFIFMKSYGDAFGFENSDATYYRDLGEFVADLIGQGNFHFYDEISKFGMNDDIADMGYGVYLGFVYYLTGKNIIAARIIKCILSSYTVLLVYRLSKRNFGEQTGRMAAIFIALWPNFWYYCGTHLKETEMVFLVVLFVEQADQMLRSRQFTLWKVGPVLLMAAALFTFRTVLGLVAIMALLFALVMSSARVVSWGKRIIVGGLAVLLIVVTAGNRIQEQTAGMFEKVQSGSQQANMEWRSKRADAGENVQKFSKYAGAAVFAPMIFSIPFSTMVRPFDGQEVQQMLNGGNFVKNILSGFTIFALVMLSLSGKWREHLLPLSFMVGYLVVLVFSAFAHSERFHQPIMPFQMMYAAFGLSVVLTKKKYKRWFTYWCVLMFVAAIAWNWFKMAGRGLS